MGQRLAAARKKQGVTVTVRAAVQQIAQTEGGLLVQYADARAAGIPVRCGKALSGANGRCAVAGTSAGFIKLVCGADTGRLLGAQLCWPRATDLTGELALAVQRGLTAADLAGLIHPHPTFAEGLRAAAEQAACCREHIVQAVLT